MRPDWIRPLLVTFTLLSATLSISYYFRVENHKSLARLVQVDGQDVKDNVSERLRQTTLALKRFASRLEYLGTSDRKFLEIDASSYLDQLTLLKRVGLIDASGRVSWSYPSQIANQVEGFDQSQNEVRGAALMQAKATRQPSLSASVPLRSGGLGFILPTAIFRRGQFIGYFYGTIEVEKLFSDLPASEHFQLTVFENGREIYSQKKTAIDHDVAGYRAPLNWGQAKLEIEAIPTKQFLLGSRSFAPMIVFFSGTLISFLIGAFLYAFSLARQNEQRRNDNEKKLSDRLENERLASLEWKKAILGGTAYSIISTDADGVILTFNAAAEELLGYESEELIGIKTPALFHDVNEVIKRAEELGTELQRKIEPGFEVFIAKAKATGKADENEWTYVRKDGRRVPISLSVTVLYDASGIVAGYLGVAVDLTERKKIQKQLFLAHDRLKRVIEATGQGIWEREFSSKKILFIDDRCKQIYGFASEETPTFAQIDGLVHPDDRERVALEVGRHVKERSPHFETEYRIDNGDKNSTERWLRAKGAVLFRDGKPDCLVATIADITIEVENRKQLQDATLKAGAATIAKSAFLASMSHEIRAPLNGIIGMTDLILETSLDETQQRYATIIQQSGTTLLTLINDILDFSKIEAGKVEFESTRFQLTSVVENQAELLVTRAHEKKISLMTFIDPALPTDLIGDPGRVGQVLLNLIGNAVKFTETGGITVRVIAGVSSDASEVDSIGENTNDKTMRIRFEVDDSGVGLTEEGRSRLFQPFIQVDGAAKGKQGGTGLGLSISKLLVESMHGEIGVESHLGKGSTFWFELPFATIANIETPVSFSDLDKLKNRKVLVVEDDSTARDVVLQYLRAWGVAGHGINSTEDAIGELHSPGGYDLVLIGQAAQSDFGLLLGINIGRELLETAPKLYLMIDFAHRISTDELVAHSFYGLLRKPIRRTALLDALNLVTAEKTVRGSEKKLEFALPENLAPSQTNRFHILVADDVAANQLLVLKQLESLGYRADAVGNGLEVLDAIQVTDYDLILMDCQMPTLDGFAATKSIRRLEDQRKNSIPVIALTASAMPGDQKECFAAGMNDYLSKPIKKEKLKLMIKKWLGDRIQTRNNVA